MMEQGRMSEYLQKLSQLMLGTQVTVSGGHALSLDEGAERAVQMILAAHSASRKVMLFGNGGSSSVVSHVQNDLCKAVGVRAIVFTEQPLLTALGNDLGYGSVYEWPAQLWGDPGDLAIAVSSSGKSENILRAVKASTARGCQIITFSGFNPDNPLRQMGALNFYVNSGVYGYVETAHAGLTHFMTDLAMSILRQPSQTTAGL